MSNFVLTSKPLEFSPKRTNERLLYGFDYKNVMLPNEMIVSGSWAVLSVSPPGASTDGMLFGSTSFSGTQCTQMITGGQHNIMYSVICTISTDLGQIISENALLKVTDSHYV